MLRGPSAANHRNSIWTVFGWPGRLVGDLGGPVSKIATKTDRGRETDVREHRVLAAFHSGEMEGLTVTPDTRQDAQEYVAGAITSDELVARARARYGLG